MSAAKPHHTVKWQDTGKDPICAPDPNYPNGIELDISEGKIPYCRVELPYPAPRIGFYLVECDRCLFSVLLTTAGRPDDPKSVTMACKPWHLSGMN